jgi:hypothetical protein
MLFAEFEQKYGSLETPIRYCQDERTGAPFVECLLWVKMSRATHFVRPAGLPQ